ncbi:MAG TPA: LCP family protein [Egibacteraceae bacterium]|nr:LCP family protein [Egibacteraceae bacterium]
MRRLVTAIVASGVLVGALAGAAVAALSLHADVRPGFTKDDGLLVILAIGSDIGPPQRPGDPLKGRADGIHLIAVDPEAQRATIVNFPRDSLVRGNKVNAQLVYGGPEQLKAALEEYTGIGIDYWALTTFRGLENMAEKMEGVEVVIDQPMHSKDAGSHFDPGPARLNGPDSLAYLRDRKSQPRGDFDRTRHHGDFMRFVHAQLRAEQSDLPQLVRMLATFTSNTATDIPADQLLPLAFLALEIEPEDVLQVPLSGGLGSTSGGASIVRLAPGDTFEKIKAGQVGP